MRADRWPRFLLAFLLAPLLMAASTAAQVAAQATRGFSTIDRLASQAIADHTIPGAVVLIGHRGRIVYRRAFGQRSLEPTRETMTADTVFDMASLTKVLATATSIMQLYQQGRIRLNDPVSRYLPAFAANSKQDITLRNLLTHYSGLPPDLELTESWQGREEGLRRAFAVRPAGPAGVRFVYSDINFIVLGALLEKLTGQSLDTYAAQNIYQPLGMAHTRFLPPQSWLPRIAPTQYDEQHHMLRGTVHDPTSRRMGGVTGHAGLFSTADDVALYAQSLLDRLAGRPSRFPLSRAVLMKMVAPGQPATATALRGFGWDIDSPFSSSRGTLLPVGSFGHTGFTGTSLWIDPVSETYVIVLANSVHPDGPHSITALRGAIADAAALALHIAPDGGRLSSRLTGYNESLAGLRHRPSRNAQVKTGIDVLEAENFAALTALHAPARIGLVTNQTGVDAQGRRTIDVLAHAPGLALATVFTPEHGLSGALDTTSIGNSVDQATHTPVVSLYGATDAARHPTPAMLHSLDAVVIDLQDAGVRFYTYETVVGYILEAAARAGTPVFVLDRPNPINGSQVQGPLSGEASSYVHYMPLPVRTA